METLLGKTLDRTYRLDQLLGKGGMGAVYKAHDVALNRDVALKMMHPHFTDDETFRARFLQEARAVAALDHPGIVKVYAFGQDQGLLYIVMDLIPGQNLHAWLRRLADEHKIIGLDETLAIVQRVAMALHYAHEKGVLHRDIKPANVLLKPTDPALREPGDLAFQPVLTDFGLAKLAEGGVHTQTGTTMGTPSYMSPEQCLGVDLTRQTDIYSLGVVLFELATGRVPFEVKSLTEAIRRHTQEPPPPPRSVNPILPVEVENIILRALAKKPQDRFATAREMADALKSALPRLSPDLTVEPTVVQGAGPYVSLMTRLTQQEAAVPRHRRRDPRPCCQPGGRLSGHTRSVGGAGQSGDGIAHGVQPWTVPRPAAGFGGRDPGGLDSVSDAQRPGAAGHGARGATGHPTSADPSDPPRTLWTDVYGYQPGFRGAAGQGQGHADRGPVCPVPQRVAASAGAGRAKGADRRREPGQQLADLCPGVAGSGRRVDL